MTRAVWLLLVLLAMPACSKKEPVRIGFLAGTSGRVADLGVAVRNGSMLAVEQSNALGGVNGRQVELLIRDDGQDPEKARKAVRELIAEKVELIIGPATSSMALAVLPDIRSSSTILLSPTVTTTELTGKDDNFLRVMDDTRIYARKSARYHRKLGRRQVAILHDEGNGSYTGSWMRDFAGEFQSLGGEVASTVGFRSGYSVPFSALAREALASKPDMVLVIANAVDAAMICQQLRKLQPGMPLAASEWASTQRFIELAGAAAEGAVISQFINHADRSPHFQLFANAYRDRFGAEPGFAGLAGYDAALVTLEAYRRRGTNGTSLKQTILAIGEFQGAQQSILIDRFGDADRATFITVVREGTYQTLE